MVFYFARTWTNTKALKLSYPPITHLLYSLICPSYAYVSPHTFPFCSRLARPKYTPPASAPTAASPAADLPPNALAQMLHVWPPLVRRVYWLWRWVFFPATSNAVPSLSWLNRGLFELAPRYERALGPTREAGVLSVDPAVMAAAVHQLGGHAAAWPTLARLRAAVRYEMDGEYGRRRAAAAASRVLSDMLQSNGPYASPFAVPAAMVHVAVSLMMCGNFLGMVLHSPSQQLLLEIPEAQRWVVLQTLAALLGESRSKPWLAGQSPLAADLTRWLSNNAVESWEDLGTIAGWCKTEAERTNHFRRWQLPPRVVGLLVLASAIHEALEVK